MKNCFVILCLSLAVSWIDCSMLLATQIGFSRAEGDFSTARNAPHHSFTSPSSGQSTVIRIPSVGERNLLIQTEAHVFPIASPSPSQLEIETILLSAQPTITTRTILVEDLVRQLEKIGLTCTLDESARDDMLEFDEKVKLPQPDQPLYVRLVYALNEKNACVAIQQGILKIISRDVSSDPDYFLTNSYNVTELDMDSYVLTNLIRTTIDPDGWDDSNGDASVVVSQINGQQLLTLSAPFLIHLRTRKLLFDLWNLSRMDAASRGYRFSKKLGSRAVELPKTRARRQNRQRPHYGGGIF